MPPRMRARSAGAPPVSAFREERVAKLSLEVPEVTERLMSTADGNAVAHRAGHVMFGALRRFVQGLPAR